MTRLHAPRKGAAALTLLLTLELLGQSPWHRVAHAQTTPAASATQKAPADAKSETASPSPDAGKSAARPAEDKPSTGSVRMRCGSQAASAAAMASTASKPLSKGGIQGAPRVAARVSIRAVANH